VVQGCVEKGLEINSGGAVYNSTGCQGVGLADVVDSLAAIDRLVFSENKISLEEFVEEVDDNFERHPELRAQMQAIGESNRMTLKFRKPE
jgi:formate C-acetyltransferase